MSGRSPVHRLIDIVVEEVSLVDRAANKRRFLVVKRHEGECVDDDTDETDETNDVGNAGGDEGGEAGGGAPGPASGTLGVATKALTALTDAVEQLADGDGDPQQVAKAVEDLGAAARELAKSAGLPEPSGGEDAFAALRATLAEVRAMVTTAPSPAPPASPPRTETNKGASSSGSSKLDVILEQVGALAKGLKEQGTLLGQRLAHLEKQVGVPNSTPAGERRRTVSDDEDEGWSFDLNRPADRESVDKSVSFHDL